MAAQKIVERLADIVVQQNKDHHTDGAENDARCIDSGRFETDPSAFDQAADTEGDQKLIRGAIDIPVIVELLLSTGRWKITNVIESP